MIAAQFQQSAGRIERVMDPSRLSGILSAWAAGDKSKYETLGRLEKFREDVVHSPARGASDRSNAADLLQEIRRVRDVIVRAENPFEIVLDQALVSRLEASFQVAQSQRDKVMDPVRFSRIIQFWSQGFVPADKTLSLLERLRVEVLALPKGSHSELSASASLLEDITVARHAIQERSGQDAALDSAGRLEIKMPA